MASIESRRDRSGRTTYRVRIRRRGAPQISRTFSRLADAREFARRIEGDIAAGRQLPDMEARRHTLQGAIDRHLASPAFKGLADNTKATHRSMLKWWGLHYGEYRLSDCNPARISEARDLLAQNRKSSSVKRYLSVLGSVMTAAVNDWGWLEDSPLRRVRSLPAGDERLRFLDDDERDRLLRVCQQHTEWPIYLVVLIAISTGMRKNEIMTLRWEQVDFGARLIQLERTKNSRRRNVPLTGLAHAELQNHARVRRIDTPLVFPPRKAGAVPRLNHPLWYKVIDEAELEDFHFHDLRHTAASYLAMNGATLLEIAEILGHSSITITKRYAHLTASHSVRVASRMTKAIFGQ